IANHHLGASRPSAIAEELPAIHNASAQKSSSPGQKIDRPSFDTATARNTSSWFNVANTPPRLITGWKSTSNAFPSAYANRSTRSRSGVAFRMRRNITTILSQWLDSRWRLARPATVPVLRQLLLMQRRPLQDHGTHSRRRIAFHDHY